MSSFTEIPKVKLLNSGRWRNMEEFSFYFNDPDGDKIVVPKGFTHDFASIPRFLWGIISPTDPRWAKAAILHDYIYIEKPINPLTVKVFTRSEADKLFYEGILILGGGELLAAIMYSAVRIGGWWYWYNVNDKIKFWLKRFRDYHNDI